jgi:ADP-heptose:LPS heptosyltransferase
MFQALQWRIGFFMRRLAIRPGAIGDLIVSLPALESLRSDYFEVWCAGANAPLVRFADRVRSIASTGLDWLGVGDVPPRLIEELRSFDEVVCWYGANRPEFRRLVAEMGLPFRFFQALPPDAAGCHATDFYLEHVREMAPSMASDGVPRIHCDVEGRRERLAILHPFSGSRRKDWPLERFRAVARGLERVMRVEWCRGPEDPALAGAVVIEDLYELAGHLARASLYVGNDSGITHLAAAVGTPVLALFGPTDPEVWGPRGEHVRIGRWGAG